MPVGAVEHGVGSRRPGGIGGKRWSAAVDAAPAHLPFRRFLLVHRRQSEVRDHRQYQNLQHRLVRPEDMGVSLDGGMILNTTNEITATILCATARAPR